MKSLSTFNVCIKSNNNKMKEVQVYRQSVLSGGSGEDNV